jgi:hypothetical protein
MDSIPDDLKRSLMDGTVLPFVGAGVSMAVRNAAGESLFPDWRGLLLGAAAWLERQRQRAQAEELRGRLNQADADLLEVAQTACEELGPIWYSYLKSVLDPPHTSARLDSLGLARSVWELRSRLVITTNFDRVLEWTCPEPLDVKSWSIEARVEKAQMLHRGLVHPTVWHLHGSIDEAENLILATEGYHRLYPGDDRPSARYQAALTALELLLASRSFLFIGFSLRDAYFVAQMRRISGLLPGGPPHYALLHSSEARRVEDEGIPVHAIYFDDYDSELLDRVRGMGAVAAQGASHRQTAQRLQGMYARATPEQVDAILEVIGHLLDEGGDPVRIMGQLQDIRGSVSSGAVLQASARVAGELGDELRAREAATAEQEEDHAQMMRITERALLELDYTRRELWAAAARGEDEMRWRIRESFRQLIDVLADELELALDQQRLSAGGVSAVLQWREIVDRSAQAGLEFVQRRLAQWERACQEEILGPGLERLTAEALAQAQRAAVRMSERWAVSLELDFARELYAERAPGLFAAASHATAALPGVALAPRQVLGILAGGGGGFQVERALKHAVALEMRRALVTAAAEAVYRVDQAAAELLRSVIEATLQVVRAYFDHLSSGEESRLMTAQHLRYELGQDAAQLARLASRVTELQRVLSPQGDAGGWRAGDGG